MLRIILRRDDLTVTSVGTQERMLNMPGRRSVRLDIAARDREGNLYDIEIQRSRDKAERKRARY